MIDQDGHLTVTVDGQPWQLPTDGRADLAPAGAVPLGRSDVLWAKQQIADELDTPVLVEVVDGGQEYNDVVVPDSYLLLDPNGPGDHPAGETGHDPKSGLESALEGGEGRYTPGEPVVVVMVVGHTVADEHGAVRFRLPAALGDRAHALLVQGQVSGTAVRYDELSQPSGYAGPAVAARAPGSAEEPDPGRPAVGTGDHEVRRRTPGRRPAPALAARRTPAAPDAGWGAL